MKSESQRRQPQRKFFSPQTSLFEPIFATEYEMEGRPTKEAGSYAQKSPPLGLQSRALPKLVDSEGRPHSKKSSNLRQSHWKRREVKAQQLITNSSLMRELKSVISARERQKAKLEADSLSTPGHKRVISDIPRGSSRISDRREQIEEEAFLVFKRDSARQVTREGSPKAPSTPYELILSHESWASRDRSSRISQRNTLPARKLPLHMKHPLIGIKPILLDQRPVSKRASQGDIARRNSSGEGGRRRFDVPRIVARERQTHMRLLESISHLNFLKLEFETNFEDLLQIAKRQELPDRNANLYGLYLVLSEMSRKQANISPEEKVGYVAQTLPETLKELSKMFRVLMKQIFANIQPAEGGAQILDQLRHQLREQVLHYVREQKGFFQDPNLLEDRSKEMVELALETIGAKFGAFCDETSAKTTQGLAVLEYLWKLGLLPYEQIYSNRDFLLEQEVQLFKQKMAVKEQELNSQKQDLIFSVKDLKEQQQIQTAKLNKVIDRLKYDNERLLDVVKDRELEMRAMKDQRARPHQALNTYLTEMEDLLQGTLQERRKQMETMGMMADVCTVDMPQSNTQMKRMKRRKMKSRRSFLDEMPSSRFSSTDKATQYVSDLSGPPSPRKSPPKGSPVAGRQLGEFLEAVEEQPHEDLAKQWENCQTIEDLASMLQRQLFGENDLTSVREIIKDLYMLAGQEARQQREEVPATAKKINIQKTEEDEDTTDPKKKALTLRGVFSAAKQNPNFRLLAGHCNYLQKMILRMEDLAILSARLEQYLQIQKRAVAQGYNSQDSEVALLFQRVPVKAPREAGVQTMVRFEAKTQVDYSKLQATRSSKRGVNPLIMLLSYVRHNARPISPVTPLTLQKAIELVDSAIEEKFKDEIAELKRVGGSVLSAKLTGGSLSQDFSSFFYDFMMLRTGRKTKAVEWLRHIETRLKLHAAKGVNLCKFYLGILGLDDEVSLSKDQEEVVLRARMLFKNVQRLWRATQASEEEKAEKHAPGDQRMNFFDLTDQLLSRAFKSDPENGVAVLRAIEPSQPVDTANKIKPNYKNLGLSSALHKISNRLHKLGKSPTYLTESLEPQNQASQLSSFIEDRCQLYLSQREASALVEAVDPKATGKRILIELGTFERDALGEVLGQAEECAGASSVSAGSFLEAILEQWRVHREKEKQRFGSVFVEFDENQDNELQLHEQGRKEIQPRFEKMLKSLEPQLRRAEVVRLYRETLDSMESQGNDMDKMIPSAFGDMALYYQLGGIGRAFFHEYFLGGAAPAKKKR